VRILQYLQYLQYLQSICNARKPKLLSALLRGAVTLKMAVSIVPISLSIGFLIFMISRVLATRAKYTQRLHKDASPLDKHGTAIAKDAF
jgi:hypothetical protein